MPYGDITGGRELVNYSDQDILKRVHSGRDANRARSVDEMIAKAQAGDQASLQRLIALSDVDGPGGEGWATPDARNYTRLMLKQKLGVDVGGYQKEGDGGGLVASIGGVLKTAAPFASLIPGVGPLAAAGLAAGGSALGGAMHGDKFNLGKTLLAGAAGAGGSALLGGQGYKGIGGIPGRLGGLFGGGHQVAGVGNVTQSGPGVLSQVGGGGGGGLFGGGGILGTGISGGDILKYAPLGIGALGAYGAYQDQKKANDLRDKATGYAEQDWMSREPIRQRAVSLGMQPAPMREDLSGLFADPGNPFYDRRQQPSPFGPLGGAGGSVAGLFGRRAA